jgi:hypothetical protein
MSILCISAAVLPSFKQKCMFACCTNFTILHAHTKHDKHMLTQIILKVQLMVLSSGNNISTYGMVSIKCATWHSFTIPHISCCGDYQTSWSSLVLASIPFNLLSYFVLIELSITEIFIIRLQVCKSRMMDSESFENVAKFKYLRVTIKNKL